AAHRGDWLAPSRINWWLIGFLDWFALGMLLAVASAWAARGGRLPRVVQTLGLTVFCGLVAFFLIFPAVFGPQDRGGLRAFLRSRVMIFLGTVSYGIY